jgi:hypothetical protein
MIIESYNHGLPPYNRTLLTYNHTLPPYNRALPDDTFLPENDFSKIHPPLPPKHVGGKNVTGVDGGPSGGSSLCKPGSKNPDYFSGSHTSLPKGVVRVVEFCMGP